MQTLARERTVVRFSVFYEGKEYYLQPLTNHLLETLRYLREHPADSRVKQAIALDLTGEALASRIRNIIQLWVKELVPNCYTTMKARERMALAFQILEWWEVENNAN